MKHLKEMKEKKNQKEISKENQQQPPRMREDFVDKIVDNSAAYARGITRKTLAEAAAKIGATVDEVNAWQAYMDESLWTFKDGSKVNWRNFRRSLRMWHKVEVNMRRDRLRREAARKAWATRFDSTTEIAKKSAEIAHQAGKDPSLWALCRERCALASACGCKRGVRVPPDRQLPRPHRPEECPHFTERNDVA